MPIIIDSSITIAWLLSEDTLADPEGFGVRLLESGAVVPSHWPLEVANALIQSVRRQRIEAGAIASYLDALHEFAIVPDVETGERAWSDTLALAQQHVLTIYDAAYLELARRTSSALATLDGRLARAAQAEGVDVIGA